jgi:hypothetical protein
MADFRVLQTDLQTTISFFLPIKQEAAVGTQGDASGSMSNTCQYRPESPASHG